MNDRDGAADLLGAAERLIEHRPRGLGAVWPRAVAHLARQALEDRLAGFWGRKAPGTERVSWHAQLTCLPYYMDEHLAERVAYAWTALSQACHYRESELLPTASELRDWIAIVAELEASLDGDAKA